MIDIKKAQMEKTTIFECPYCKKENHIYHTYFKDGQETFCKYCIKVLVLVNEI